MLEVYSDLSGISHQENAHLLERERQHNQELILQLSYSDIAFEDANCSGNALNSCVDAVRPATGRPMLKRFYRPVTRWRVLWLFDLIR